MKKILFCLVLFMGQFCIGSQAQVKTGQLSEIEALSILEQDNSGAASEEVDDTVTVFVDEIAPAAVQPRVFDSEDGSSEAADVHAQPAKSDAKSLEKVKTIVLEKRRNNQPLDISEPKIVSPPPLRPRARTDAAVQEVQAEQLKRAGFLLGERAIHTALTTDNIDAERKSPRGSSDRKNTRGFFGLRSSNNRNSEADGSVDSYDEEKKSPRTFGRKMGKMFNRDKEKFKGKLDELKHLKKLEETHFSALLNEAREAECINLLADWCANNPSKITISSFKTLLFVFVQAMSEGTIEKVNLEGSETTEHEDSDQSEQQDSEKSDGSKQRKPKKPITFAIVDKVVSVRWQKVVNAFQKILQSIDACGKKLAHDYAQIFKEKILEVLRVQIPDDFEVDEHLCTALSYAMAALDDAAAEVEICEQLRQAAESSDEQLMVEFVDRLKLVVEQAEGNLSGEESKFFQKIKQHYGGEFPIENLLISFVYQFSGQLEKELYDKLIALVQKLDSEDVKLAYKETTLSFLARWALSHGNRLPRASKKAISDLDVIAAGSKDKAKGVMGRYNRNVEGSGKMTGEKLEILEGMGGVRYAPPIRPDAKRASDGPSESSSGSPLSSPQRDKDAQKPQKAAAPIATVRSPKYDEKTTAGLQELAEGGDDTNARLAKVAEAHQKAGTGSAVKTIGRGTLKGSPLGDRRAAPKPQETPPPAKPVTAARSPRYDEKTTAGLQELAEGGDDTNARLAKVAAGYQKTATDSAVKTIGRGTLKGSPLGDRRAVPKPQETPPPAKPVTAARSPRYDEKATTDLQELAEGGDDTNARLAKVAEAHQKAGTVSKGTVKKKYSPERKQANDSRSRIGVSTFLDDELADSRFEPLQESFESDMPSTLHSEDGEDKSEQKPTASEVRRKPLPVPQGRAATTSAAVTKSAPQLEESAEGSGLSDGDE